MIQRKKTYFSKRRIDVKVQAIREIHYLDISYGISTELTFLNSKGMGSHVSQTSFGFNETF